MKSRRAPPSGVICAPAFTEDKLAVIRTRTARRTKSISDMPKRLRVGGDRTNPASSLTPFDTGILSHPTLCWRARLLAVGACRAANAAELRPVPNLWGPAE